MFFDPVVPLDPKLSPNEQSRVEASSANILLGLFCLSACAMFESQLLPQKNQEINNSVPNVLTLSQINELRNTGSYEVDYDVTEGPESFIPYQTQAVQDMQIWLRENPSADVHKVIDQVWSVVNRQLGSYDKATSDFLQQRKNWRAEIKELYDKLNADFPVYVTIAARDLTKQLAFELSPLPLLRNASASFDLSRQDADVAISPSLQTYIEYNTIASEVATHPVETSNLRSQSEAVIAHWSAQYRPATFSGNHIQMAQDYLESRRTLLANIETVEKQLITTGFPPIPNETSPNDISKIPYGKSLCRFSAPLACTLFNLAGESAVMVRVSVTAKFVAEEHVLVYLPRIKQFYESTADNSQYTLRQADIISLADDGRVEISFGDDSKYYVSYVGYPNNYDTNIFPKLSAVETFIGSDRRSLLK